MTRKDNHLVGLDVGTSKVAAIVAEPVGDGIDVIGVGVVEAQGIRGGVVINLEAAVESIRKAVEEAELTAGVEIDSVVLGLSGAHLKALNSRGVVAVADRHREITPGDVRRAIDAAKAVTLPTGREIVHLLAQNFVVDGEDAVGAPVGVTGSRLEVNVHVVTGSIASTQNIIACVNQAGVEVADMFIEQLAASESVLTTAERDLGVALADIGGGTTDLAVVERGSLWHTGVVTLGGDHFTNDVAVNLRMSKADAERTKRLHGCALDAMVGEDERIEVASVGGRPPRKVSRRVLSQVLQLRAEELFHKVWDEIQRAGYEDSLHSGIVLCGGGALLEGMAEIAEQIFNLPIRCGRPAGVGGLTDHVNSPAFAPGVGLVRHAHRRQRQEPVRKGWWDVDRSLAGRLRGLSRFLGRVRSRSWA